MSSSFIHSTSSEPASEPCGFGLIESILWQNEQVTLLILLVLSAISSISLVAEFSMSRIFENI